MSSGRHSFALLIVYLVLSAIEVASSPSTLRHVNLLYRHGDRSPIVIYPKDRNQIDVWPDGLGWLSNIGKQQQYELGQYLRKRYDGFINVTHFDHRQIAIQSSAVERCLMSAYSNLAGLFPPQADQIWHDKLLWQPIPVKSVPLMQDNKISLRASCPRYDQLMNEAYASTKTLDFMRENKAFLKNVSQNTGCNETLSNIWEVTDALICEHAHSKKWNDWAYGEGVFKKLKEVTIFGWDLLFAKAEAAKLKGGPLLKEMIENMKAASNGNSKDLKIHMYSGHDTTVAALLSAMTVFDKLQPPYRSLIMVELHKINNNDVVKIFLRNETGKDPYPLHPRDCEDHCKLSTFENVLAARIPQDWQEECKVQALAAHGITPASWIVLALGCFLALTIIIGIWILVRRKRHSYSQV